ncbi:DUF2778 domain-containing protein [Bradyrhizobium canariense]|uniref:DUF2778 domain-containing protein n=1 Tax=Bradyrhizobium canariense TaxID=255045 RepID=UPI001FCDB0BC|nr:DUF2778 domain-containing protein [Bradyrhizobium canariense]
MVFGDGSLKTADASSFEDRFLPISRAPSVNVSPRLLVQAWSSELELKLHQAKSRLAQRLQAQDLLQDLPQASSQDVQTAVIEEPKPSISPAVPLPRSRPVEANLDAQSAPASGAAVAARPEDRTLLQKLGDLLPTGGIKLASLGPDGGLLGGGPDLAALGYDKLTAVYDISAHAVYLPNGSKIEAHSGMGRLMDDPEHVSERMVGATPPAIYDLKPRERLFHGVEALRMIPQDSNATLGRSGLLTHSYMLGPNGDSNGCVSIRDYDRFLSAYKNGEFTHLVVVPRLNATAPDTRRADSQT